MNKKDKIVLSNLSHAAIQAAEQIEAYVGGANYTQADLLEIAGYLRKQASETDAEYAENLRNIAKYTFRFFDCIDNGRISVFWYSQMKESLKKYKEAQEK
jgi:hypothetical protein